MSGIKCDCGRPAIGMFYYSYRGGIWKYQCSEYPFRFQAFKPITKKLKAQKGENNE